jgi:hypothetical protein
MDIPRAEQRRLDSLDTNKRSRELQNWNKCLIRQLVIHTNLLQRARPIASLHAEVAVVFAVAPDDPQTYG